MTTNRFQVSENANGKYIVIDTKEDKLCAYSGAAENPPKYAGECKCNFHEWNNYYSALGFANKLEAKNN